MPAFKLGSPSPFRSASTDGNGWRNRCMPPVSTTCSRTTAFPYIASWTQAQRLMDRQLKTKWPKLLNGIARQLNPIHAQIFRKHPISYYWSTYQHEWAIDVVFHHAADLRRFRSEERRVGKELRSC